MQHNIEGMWVQHHRNQSTATWRCNDGTYPSSSKSIKHSRFSCPSRVRTTRLIFAATMSAAVWTGIFFALAGFYLANFYSRKRQQLPLPPGPRPKPIIGNLSDLPNSTEKDWEFWLKHKRLYGNSPVANNDAVTKYFCTGPISSLSVMGQTIIIVNDARLAVELMEKRSAIYISRPHQNFAEM